MGAPNLHLKAIFHGSIEYVLALYRKAQGFGFATAEHETAFARIGDAGEQQIETRGLLAAVFDHRDSRACDAVAPPALGCVPSGSALPRRALSLAGGGSGRPGLER